MNIFVGGSLRDVPVYGELCSEFVRKLGARIVEDGHTLLTGCRGSLDETIAEAAHSKIMASGDSEESRQRLRDSLISYRLKKDEPGHRYGRILVSRREDWNLTHPELSPPEQIAGADVAIFIAGSEGTFFAANWARIAEKPILGIAQFGGAGAGIFEHERQRFQKKYTRFMDMQDYDLLSQDTDDVDQLVEDVLSLCHRVTTSTTVFTIMPFKEEYDDLFATYEKVCKDYGFAAIRTDKTLTNERIVQRILKGIERSAFLLADVTEHSPNVFFEIGYAQGLGKEVIITAKEESKERLPFDIADIPIEFWRTQVQLTELLERRINAMFPERRE